VGNVRLTLQNTCQNILVTTVSAYLVQLIVLLSTSIRRRLYLFQTVLLFDRPFVFRIYFLEFSGLMGYYMVPFDASPGGDDFESEEDNKNEDDDNDNDEEGTRNWNHWYEDCYDTCTDSDWSDSEWNDGPKPTPQGNFSLRLWYFQ
jgi:hypothetical protein